MSHRAAEQSKRQSAHDRLPDEVELPVRGWMRRETYDAIVDLVPAVYVLANLRARFGAEIDTPSHSPDDRWTRPRKLAHDFADIHAHVAGSVVDPSSLRPPTWSSDAPSATDRPLCAAYLPVDGGDRAAGVPHIRHRLRWTGSP